MTRMCWSCCRVVFLARRVCAKWGLSLSASLFCRKKMKARAPPPPGNPALLNTLDKQRPLGSSDLSLQSNLAPVRDGPLTLTVVLPSGLEKQSVVSSR